MASSTSPAGVDTNVLVYAVDPTARQHPPARTLVFGSGAPGPELVVLPQVATEFVSVITGSRVSAASRRTTAGGIALLETILLLPNVALLDDPPGLTGAFLALLAQHPVAGPRVYDRRLAAALLAHRLPTLYTFNTNDFAGVGGLAAVAPAP